ncbi:MAG: hypothetical protein M0P58_04345 [Bacteroidales bacterium]|jgi:hypothetical protein|nr:hypothetical protein [Bacteroidales bacterium]
METLNNIFASLDIFQVLLNSFPSIVDPIAHGFQYLFAHLFTSFKDFVRTNPGLMSGAIFMALVYTVMALVKKRKKIRGQIIRSH